MPDNKVPENDLTLVGALATTDYIRAVRNPATTPESVNILVSDLQPDAQPEWYPEIATLTYSSVDGPTGVVSANADLTTSLSKGKRMRFEQSHALTGYWPFDSNSSPAVGSFTMGDIGTPTYTAGKFSNALTLDGSTDALSITDVSTLKPTGEFTIGAWFKTSSSGTQQEIFQSYSANTNVAGILFGISSANLLRVVVGKNTGTTVNSDYSIFTSPSTVNDGNWHYAVFAYRNNYGQLYLDGNLIVSGYCMTPAYAGTNYIRVGCANSTGSNSGWFNGQIDDLFVINGYALDEKTIRDQYRAGTAQGTGSITVSKHAIITDVGPYSGGSTSITAYFGSDFSLANSTISNPFFSGAKVPFGFNPDPRKWTVLLTDAIQRTQATPTQYAVYNIGSLSFSCPIGNWTLGFEVEVGVTCNIAVVDGGMAASLSASSSAFDADFTEVWLFNNSTGAHTYRKKFSRQKSYGTRTKTTLYLLGTCNWSGASSLDFYGNSMKTFVYAICAYL